jgi:hypothetical protein
VSDPPPGAVLITNSTGRVGCTEAAADPVGLGLLATGVAQEVRVTSAAAKIVAVLITVLDMTRTSIYAGTHRGVLEVTPAV